jgi:hypothetical protein
VGEVWRLGRRPTLLLGALLLVVGGGAPDVGAEAEYAAAVAAPRTTRVVVVTLDALGSRAVRHLPRRRTPTLHRLLREGTGTLEARTVREQTATLPNHTSIATGRRVRAAAGGHGVTWNDERLDPRTVQEAAGHAVASLFSVVGSSERHPALFTAKDKLTLLDRSWPAGVARLVVRHDNRRLARAARRDLLRNRRPLTFLHLSLPDDAGHAHGFSSPAYFRAVTRVDRLLGTLVETIDSRRRLRRHVTLVVTADHGGRGAGHYDPAAPADYRIPFVVWGVGVAPGTDLYDLNPDYRDPHRRRTTYRADRQPVRNADAANLATRLLGLGVVPGSEFGANSPLDVS